MFSRRTKEIWDGQHQKVSTSFSPSDGLKISKKTDQLKNNINTYTCIRYMRISLDHLRLVNKNIEAVASGWIKNAQPCFNTSMACKMSSMSIFSDNFDDSCPSVLQNMVYREWPLISPFARTKRSKIFKLLHSRQIYNPNGHINTISIQLIRIIHIACLLPHQHIIY